MPNTQDTQTAIEWDITTWSRALDKWLEYFDKNNLKNLTGLEIGSRNGGLSYLFARKYQCRMYCSDYGYPSNRAKELHRKEKLEGLISYHDVDASNMPFEKAQFDFVVFKSVLGVVGRLDQYNQQEKAIQEIYRVLKPGGVLFFAENAKGSFLHQWARRKFIPWGKSWRYVNWAEMEKLLSIFSEKDIKSTGFWAAFVPKPMWLKSCAAHFDKLFPFIPHHWNYVMYGYAVK